MAANFEVGDEYGEPFDLEDMPGRRIFRGEPPGVALLQVRNPKSGHEWWVRARAGAVLGLNGEPELAINIWHEVTTERRRERDARCLSDATAVLAASLDHDAMLSTFARTLVPQLADLCTICLDSAGGVRLIGGDRGPDECPEEVLQSARRVAVSGTFELLDHSAGGAWSCLLTVPIRSADKIRGALSLALTKSGRRYGEQDLLLVDELARRVGIALENAQFYRAAREAALTAEAAARSAAHANRAKDDFLATASHELRTPLNAIVGWASMLRSKQLDPAAAKGIEVIYRNALMQVKIIEDILDVSRIVEGKLRLEIRLTDLAVITRDAVEVVRPAALAKRIEISVEAPADCPFLGDPERLQQVMGNLLSNAVKFTDAEGSISVAVRPRQSSVLVYVSDTGRGIEPELLPLVFERFKQGDSSSTRRFGGLGLGLALVRHIVELHGGSVAARSDGPGRGATFTIAMPTGVEPRVGGSEQHSSGAEETELPRGILAGVPVLVVDDDHDARDLLSAVLTQAGASVTTAGSAPEAFRSFSSFRPQVLLSDIAMPGEDGYSLVRRIRALSRRDGGEIPAIALTAHTRREDVAYALESGFTAHLGKPVDLHGLVATVAALVSTRNAAD